MLILLTSKYGKVTTCACSLIPRPYQPQRGSLSVSHAESEKAIRTGVGSVWERDYVLMHTCVHRVPRHSPRVNCGFNPIQQQPLHCGRQQQTTYPRVSFFWIEETLGLARWKTGGDCIFSFSLEAIHRFLLRVPVP